MSYYFIANIRMNNPAVYEKYLDECNDVFSKYKGEYLAIDESPLIIEGKWNYSKSVIIKFNSKKDFEDWYYSADYQKILKFRLDAADCDSILLEGLS